MLIIADLTGITTKAINPKRLLAELTAQVVWHFGASPLPLPAMPCAATHVRLIYLGAGAAPLGSFVLIGDWPRDKNP